MNHHFTVSEFYCFAWELYCNLDGVNLSFLQQIGLRAMSCLELQTNDSFRQSKLLQIQSLVLASNLVTGQDIFFDHDEWFLTDLNACYLLK